MTSLTIIGGGRAGSEAAWQAAQLGLKVRLYEMRPAIPAGVLKNELRGLNSTLLDCAEAATLPAGWVKIPQALRLRLDFVIIRNSRKGRL